MTDDQKMPDKSWPIPPIGYLLYGDVLYVPATREAELMACVRDLAKSLKHWCWADTALQEHAYIIAQANGEVGK